MSASSDPAAAPPPARKTGTTAFTATALGITWLLQLPAVLSHYGWIAGPPERFIPLVGLGAFGPILAAVIVSWVESGRGGLGELFRPLRIWRVGAGWYLVALGLFAAVHLAGTAVYTLLGGRHAGPWLYLPASGPYLVAMVVFPLAEEPGWRGFALPRLQQRYGALSASLRLGAVWALWHAMMFVLQGMTPAMFAVAVVNILAGSVLFSWIYNHTRGSLLLAIVAHVGVHLDNPAHAMPANVSPFAVYTVALCVAACAVVVADPAAWRTARREGPSRHRVTSAVPAAAPRDA